MNSLKKNNRVNNPLQRRTLTTQNDRFFFESFSFGEGLDEAAFANARRKAAY
jgi:hypothetical protein